VRLIGRLTCSAVLMAFVAAPSTAQPLDKRTYFKFSGPVAVPGTTLPAGEYLFRIANPDSGRNVVQVMNADGSKPLGMFFTIRAERLDPSDKPEVSFIETAAGNPAAVRTWWYPGERSGFEFIYPKEQARQLAKATSQPVLTTRSETTKTEQTDTTELARVNATGQDVNVNPSATPAPSSPGDRMQQGTIAQSNPPAANQSSGQTPASGATARQSTQSARASLPRTASITPTVAFAGILLLLAAAGIWMWDLRRLAVRGNR
jgi:hypothetical protein